MTNTEALEKANEFRYPWMSVSGVPDVRKVAELIGRTYGVQIAVGDSEAFIECADVVEDKFCMSDERLEDACEELNAQLPFSVRPENFEF